MRTGKVAVMPLSSSGAWRTRGVLRHAPTYVRGFTYIGLLIAVALIGTALATAGVVWHTEQQRERERELLFVGDQFRQAIKRYYKTGAREYPQSLEDLVRDPRQPGVVRHLRKIYRDPITGKAEWGLVKTIGDRIMGVYSLSDEQPLKQSNFDHSEREFEGKEKYSQWTFVYQPEQTRPRTPGSVAPQGSS